METKEFETCHVLTAITGRLMGDIGGLYELLNWMTGESVYTHQIGRISQEAIPVILAAHPKLEVAMQEADNVDTDNVFEWRDTWNARYGKTISIPKFTRAEHERIDPISELAEKVHPDRIITVKT